MTECYLKVEGENVPVRCDNCGWEGTHEETTIIADIQERISPGCIVPAGECPSCGALAYLTKPPAYSAQAQLEALEATNKEKVSG